MRPEKFLGIEFFQTPDKNTFAVVASRDGLRPSNPIVCLNTGLACEWADFDDTMIIEIELDIGKIFDTQATSQHNRFGSLTPGTLFVFKDRDGSNPEAGIKLFGSPTENDTGKMLGNISGHFLALCLSNRQFYFGIHALFDFVRDMMWWPVETVNLPIDELTHATNKG